MKTIKLLFYTLLLSIVVLSSCTNDDGNEAPEFQESETIQTTLNHLRTLYHDDGTAIEEMNPSGNLIFDFCFEFVYPINLIYNTGSVITINSNEELIEVLINSNNQLYIVGIEFPFDVEIFNSEINEVEILTITNEDEFIELLISCDFGNSCDCDNEIDPVCVEIIQGDEVILITFPNECFALCEGFTPNNFVDCDGCDCENIEDPVCVEIEENGQIITLTFLNACEAICAGFTENDFVDCENDIECDISELEVVVGECNNDGTYNLTINFEYEGTNNQEYFDLYVRDNELIGYFSLSELPLTIENFPLSGYEYDYLKVCINDNVECCEELEWIAPECDPINECDISNLEVEVGDCNADDTYSITIDFDYENTNGQEYFDLYVRNGEFIGYFELSELPITIDNFNFSGYEYDYLKVCINDIPDCCEELEWLPPECDPNPDCYQYGFPINMYLDGTTVSVNSNELVDYYLDLGYDLVYPIELIINNEILLVHQGILEGAYGERCD
jgi:uncharacterized protein YuzE